MITLFCARSAAIHNSVHYSFIVSPTLPLRSCRQQKLRRGVYSLSLAFSAFMGYTPLDYCIYACVTLVHDPLELWSKNPSFYFKIYLDGWLWSALIFKRFFAPFHLPYSGISRKIGHTGIANTKKLLDQAVFPCWSNYHTLAGE